MNDAVAGAAGTPETDYVAPSSGLLDLSRQQRNLLLLRPLFALELNKQRIGDEDSAPFQGIDTHYLVLTALDRMMEGTTVSTGCTSDEVLTHIADVAAVMRPALTKAQLLKIAETVLAALDNKANQYKEFAFEHFDAARRGTRTVRFRLVTYEPDIEDVYRYKPTPEGYLVYLGMLDLAPEDAQELMEKMLDLLVQRGRFDAALEIAKRARTHSIEYRQLIRDKLHQAYRAPGTVNWTRDMGPGLDRARDHVRQRQAEDQRMEESVLEALRQAEEPRARTNLALLLKTLQSASMLRSQLVGDISGPTTASSSRSAQSSEHGGPPGCLTSSRGCCRSSSSFRPPTWPGRPSMRSARCTRRPCPASTTSTRCSRCCWSSALKTGNPKRMTAKSSRSHLLLCSSTNRSSSRSPNGWEASFRWVSRGASTSCFTKQRTPVSTGRCAGVWSLSCSGRIRTRKLTSRTCEPRRWKSSSPTSPAEQICASRPREGIRD